jgi:hypothetical protein
MDDKNFWSFTDIAADLDLAYTTIRRNIETFIKQKKMKPLTRMKADKGHFCSVMDSTQYSLFRELMRGRTAVNKDDDSVNDKMSDDGFFYLILLVPEFSDGRIKAGFTSRLDSRFSEHLMSAPTAKLIYSTPCQRAWETFLLAYVHSHGKKIRSEVFDVPDTKVLIKNLKTLFSQVGQRK